MRDAGGQCGEREEELVAPGLGAQLGGLRRGPGGGTVRARDEVAWSKPRCDTSGALSLPLLQTHFLILPFQLLTVDYGINNKYALLCVFSRLISGNLTVALIKGVCAGSSPS